MGTHYKGTKKEVLSLNSYIKLIRAAEAINYRMNTELSKSNLTESQFGVLEALLHLGPLCQKELGSKLLKSGGNITMVIDNLEKRGLVKRERGEKDRRFFSIHLTRQGKNLIEKLFPLHLNYIVEQMDVLSEEEHLKLQKLCKKIGLKEEKEAEVS